MTYEVHVCKGNQSIHFSVRPCWLGWVLAANSDQGLCAVFLGDDPGALTGDLQSCFPKARLVEDRGVCARIMLRVAEVIESPSRELDLPLDVAGTPFAQKVWQELAKVPPGETVTYAEIARRLGMPLSARAVGRACAANRLAVVIPCHRVVRADGGLAGYRWGISRKRALLEREKGFCATQKYI